MFLHVTGFRDGGGEGGGPSGDRGKEQGADGKETNGVPVSEVVMR